MALAVVVMTLAMAQAMAPETPVTVTEPAATSAPPANDSTVSGVVVTPKAKESPKVYAPSYKAAPHLGPQAPQIRGSSNIDALFVDQRFRSATISSLVVSQLAAQRHRAQKAAALINAGHCPEALQAVFNEGDAHLITRVAEVCGLPSPMERAKGPPF